MTLSEGLAALGYRASPAQLSALETFQTEIGLWNSKLKLTAPGRGDFMARHLFDSLAPCAFFKQRNYTHVADVGSGAGLPGIPLAIMFPHTRFTLIERMGRRVDFLRNVVLLCGLRERVAIRHAPIEEVRDEFPCVTFRAFRSLPEFLPALLAITRAGGELAAYKGRKATVEQELADIAKARIKIEVRAIQPLQVPGLQEERHLVVLGKAPY